MCFLGEVILEKGTSMCFLGEVILEKGTSMCFLGEVILGKGTSMCFLGEVILEKGTSMCFWGELYEIRKVCDRKQGGAALCGSPSIGRFANRPYVMRSHTPQISYKPTTLLERSRTRGFCSQAIWRTTHPLDHHLLFCLCRLKNRTRENKAWYTGPEYLPVRGPSAFGA
ncbi:hypothetical protein L6R29_10825 [Myxococcota bacterium]|nr:hypothetical protein [Myxococcota bacterium]